MTRAAILAAFLAFPAHADTWCEFGPNGTNATILEHEDHFAQVHISNRLASRKQTTCALTLWGVTVEVLYEAQPFDAPDTFTVTPPAGFIAIPDQITIPDRDWGRVLIILQEGVGS